MATRIKETPVLAGRDAMTFVEKMKMADSSPVNHKERARIKENFAKMQAISKF